MIFFSYKIFCFNNINNYKYFFDKDLKIFKFRLQTILVFLTFINLNPYLTRFYIAVPTIINDLIFIAGILIILKKLLQKIKITFFIFIGYTFTFASRQTSIGLILAYLVSLFVREKKLISTKYLIIGLLTFIFF